VVSTQYYTRWHWQAYEMKLNRNYDKIAGRFYIVFQMNNAKISNFQKC